MELKQIYDVKNLKLRFKNKKALEHANNLGIAMQITNICRDVREDAENDRIYLPADLLPSKLSIEDFISGNIETLKAISSTQERLLKMADELYVTSSAGIDYLPWRMRIVVRWAAKMYREIGTVISYNPNHYYKNRAVVNWLIKMYFLFQCLFRSLYKK